MKQSCKNALFAAALGLIVLIGLNYRLIFAYNIHFTNLHMGTQFGHDEYYYIKMAQNIVRHGVYGYMTDAAPNAYVTPGYPLFIAAVFSVFGDESVIYVKVIQAFLSTASILLVFLIGKRLSGKAAGLIAAAFAALYPPLVLYSRFLLTETLYVFIFLLYFLFQLIALDKESAKHHIFAGLLFAAAILVRPLIVVLLPLPYVYKFISAENCRNKVPVQFAAFLTGFVALMLPWWIRNIVTMKKFIFLCTQSNPFYYGIIKDYATLPPSCNEATDGIKLIINNLRTDPVETVKWYTIGKINMIFGNQDYWIQQGHVYLSSVGLLHYFILVSGTVGIFMAIFKKEIRLISLFTLLNTAFQLLFIPVERYAVPIMPMLSITGAYMLCYLFRKLGEDSKPPQTE